MPTRRGLLGAGLLGLLAGCTSQDGDGREPERQESTTGAPEGTPTASTRASGERELPYTFVSRTFDIFPGDFAEPAVTLDRTATIEAGFQVRDDQQPIDCVLMTAAQAAEFVQGGREYLDGAAVMGETAGTISHEVPEGEYRLIVDYSGAFETVAPFPDEGTEITVDVTGTVTA